MICVSFLDPFAVPKFQEHVSVVNSFFLLFFSIFFREFFLGFLKCGNSAENFPECFWNWIWWVRGSASIVISVLLNREAKNSIPGCIDTMLVTILCFDPLAPGTRFTKKNFTHNPNSKKILFCSNSVPGLLIATNVCTCYGNIAVVACAKFCSNHFIWLWLRTDLIYP